MSKEESILFLTLAAGGFILCRIPYAGKFFRVFNTLFHEGGHALAAWFTKSEVLRIDLFYDTSGTTITKSTNRTAQFVISLSGYVFASLAPFVFIVLLSAGYDWGLHVTMALLSGLLLLLAVRNTYGILWIVAMLAAYFFVIFKAPEKAWMMIYAYTGIMLLEALFSSFVIVWFSIVRPSEAGDATNLAKLTHLPAAFWGLVFLAQALLFFYLSVLILF